MVIGKSPFWYASDIIPLPLIAQNGSVVRLNEFYDPTVPISGLVPVAAISCYGCEEIQLADASECPGRFNLIWEK